MPEERGLYPKQPVARPADLPRAAARDDDRAAPRIGQRDHLERFGLAERAKDHVEKRSAGQPAAGADHRRGAAPARPPSCSTSRSAGLDPEAVDAMADMLREPRGVRGAGAVQQPPARPRRAAVRPPRRAGPGPGRRPGSRRRAAQPAVPPATGSSRTAMPAGCATCAASTSLDVDGVGRAARARDRRAPSRPCSGGDAPRRAVHEFVRVVPPLGRDLP